MFSCFDRQVPAMTVFSGRCNYLFSNFATVLGGSCCQSLHTLQVSTTGVNLEANGSGRTDGSGNLSVRLAADLDQAVRELPGLSSRPKLGGKFCILETRRDTQN